MRARWVRRTYRLRLRRTGRFLGSRRGLSPRDVLRLVLGAPLKIMRNSVDHVA
jgi:hypothetical protein